MRFQLIRSTLALTAALALMALPVAASDAGDTARSNPLCASGLAANLGIGNAIPVSGCPAFCSSHADCETACPSIPGVYCDFGTWTCADPNEHDGDEGEDCPAFCSSHADCESACPEVTGVYCDFNTWTCKN